MTVTKIALAGTAMAALLLLFAYPRHDPPVILRAVQAAPDTVQTVQTVQFDPPPSFVPGEATKMAALKRAFELNGNSMVGYVDLTTAPAIVKTVPITIAAAPQPQDEQPNEELPPPPKTIDLCSRHGMHKVFSNHGQTWRCRR